MNSCEESLFPHLWEEKVEPLLWSLVDANEQEELVHKMSTKLEGLSQSFFEIPKTCESPSRWSAATLEMSVRLSFCRLISNSIILKSSFYCTACTFDQLLTHILVFFN